jgi:hypothetical protein
LLKLAATPDAGRWRSMRRQHRPGAIAGDRDTARFEAASKEVAIAGDGILDRRGERVLGRKPVIGNGNLRCSKTWR